MTPVRVLQLATAGPLYGAERWILALMNNLDPAAAACELAVLDDMPGIEPPLLAAARHDGLTGHAIPCAGRVDMGAVRALRRLIRERAIAIVHTHGYKADVMALLAVRGTSARTLATPHGWSEQATRAVAAYERLDRAIFGLFDAVAPLSPELCADVRRNRFAARKLHYIPNGVDLTEIDAARAAVAALPPIGGAPVIGYVGQLIARKDIETLLHAFARWSRADARLVLVGDGDGRARLEDIARDLGIADRTTFTGFTPARLEWMARFDAFVLPSRKEGIPRCLMEAMALGVPVIASDIPGNRELIEPGVTGLSFAVGDVDALRDAFDRLFAEGADAFRTGLAQAGRDHVEQGFSGRSMARGYERLFAQMTSGGAARPAEPA